MGFETYVESRTEWFQFLVVLIPLVEEDQRVLKGEKATLSGCRTLGESGLV